MNFQSSGTEFCLKVGSSFGFDTKILIYKSKFGKFQLNAVSTYLENSKKLSAFHHIKRVDSGNQTASLADFRAAFVNGHHQNVKK